MSEMKIADFKPLTGHLKSAISLCALPERHLTVSKNEN
jgi:hypothetical protein